MSSWTLAAWLMLGGSTLLLFIGMPVALTFIAVNIVGAWLYMGGEAGLAQLARSSVSSVTSFSLTPIPLFVLMGEVLFHTGLALKVIEGVERLIRRLPGRLAVVAVVAGTVFSAISGSTIATTAMLGSLMLPVMLARGYHPTMATGPIMAIGAVDMLIPPSALTVLLGSLSSGTGLRINVPTPKNAPGASAAVPERLSLPRSPTSATTQGIAAISINAAHKPMDARQPAAFATSKASIARMMAPRCMASASRLVTVPCRSGRCFFTSDGPKTLPMPCRTARAAERVEK